MSFWGRIRTLLGRAPKKPPLRSSRASASVPAPPLDPRRPSMKWEVQRAGPRFRGNTWIKRISKRQQVLVALAAVSVMAMISVLVVRLTAEKRLPQSVQGLWRTSVPEYSGRLVELRSRRVAFLTGDSASPVSSFIIKRVRRIDEATGMAFHVEFEDESGLQEFSFVYDQGPPDHIRFANQPRLVWNRDPSNRSLLPGF